MLLPNPHKAISCTRLPQFLDCKDEDPNEPDVLEEVIPVYDLQHASASTRHSTGSGADRFALGEFLALWSGRATHDLSTSDSETLSLSSLLSMATSDARDGWHELRLGYTNPCGSQALRAAIAARHRVLRADDILCCCGAQEAVACVLKVLLPPGSHAVLLLPIYQPSELVLGSLCAVTGLALREDEDWQPDPDRIEAALRPETRVVMMNFPNSPTGASVDPDRLEALVAICRRRGVWLVNDEIYRQTEIVQGVRQPPMLADLYERGVSINGLSKGFGLPGLRVGWIACRDRALLDAALVAKSTLSTCLSAGSVILAAIALAAEDRIVPAARAIGAANWRKLQAIIDARPDLFTQEPACNLAICYPRYLGMGGATAFADRLAREKGILLLPGMLWKTTLAPLPMDRIRIGLGHMRSGSALDALSAACGI